MDLVLISGLSGSGKSIALAMLEDTGYFCVDNLPATLLPDLISQLGSEGYARVGVAIDVRGGPSLKLLPEMVARLRGEVRLSFLFLDAKDDTLLRRYSETRRRHPLADGGLTLIEAIREERQRLAPVAQLGHHLDTSDLKPAVLREWIRDFLALEGQESLTLLFASFGFKHGVPLDADLVFDARCLPNPYYDPALRPLTGRDAHVVAFLEAQPEALRMRADILGFVVDWLPAYARDSRAYLTVAVGCTGGQHRSVYLAEWLAAEIRGLTAAGGVNGVCPRILVRHRELTARQGGTGAAGAAC